jgi:hypothetical protein
MDIESLFAPYEQAVQLAELGFDEPCLKYQWNDKKASLWMLESPRPNALHTQKYWTDGENKCFYTTSIPMFAQAFTWFREKHSIHSYIDCKWKNLGWEYELVDLNKMESISSIGNYGYNKAEEAELACLIKLIEIVKPK